MIERIRNACRVYRKRKALRETRRTFAMFGYNLSGFSDEEEEIEEGLIEIAKRFSKAGIMAKEFMGV